MTVIALGLTMTPARMYRLSWAMAAVGIGEIISPWVILMATGRSRAA